MGNLLEQKASKLTGKIFSKDKNNAEHLDIIHQEMIIHGTFIENLESILRNGFDDSLSKRQHDGYQEPYPSDQQGRYPWEQPYGAGLFFERINGKTAQNLNYYNLNLKNLLEILEVWDLIIEEKNEPIVNFKSRSKKVQAALNEDISGSGNKIADSYSREIQQAINKYVRENSTIELGKQLTIFDLIDVNGERKDYLFTDKSGAAGKIFYDKDGWLKVWRDNQSNNKGFAWGQGFTKTYPIHLVMDSKYFSDGRRSSKDYPGYSEYYTSFKYEGNPLPPESIRGVIISYDIDKITSDSDEHISLTRKSYIPSRNQENQEPKGIRRDVLIRFVGQLLKKIKKDKPGFEVPVYDEKGDLIFQI